VRTHTEPGAERRQAREDHHGRAQYRHHGNPDTAAPPALVTGFGNVRERAIEPAIACVADLLSSAELEAGTPLPFGAKDLDPLIPNGSGLRLYRPGIPAYAARRVMRTAATARASAGQAMRTSTDSAGASKFVAGCSATTW
jgi:hypothetical protein